MHQQTDRRAGQIEVHDVEAYHYDGECLAKAEELGKPGVLTVKQLQARPTTQPEPYVFPLQLRQRMLGQG